MCSLQILYFPFCTSAVAYTVALGLFLAVGRETTGKIPQGKVRAPEKCLFSVKRLDLRAALELHESESCQISEGSDEKSLKPKSNNSIK